VRDGQTLNSDNRERNNLFPGSEKFPGISFNSYPNFRAPLRPGNGGEPKFRVWCPDSFPLPGSFSHPTGGSQREKVCRGYTGGENLLPGGNKGCLRGKKVWGSARKIYWGGGPHTERVREERLLFFPTGRFYYRTKRRGENTRWFFKGRRALSCVVEKPRRFVL